ncbi:MAG: sugar phosphate isomerase/epimerase [Verrucomicrobiae bacterium]|nr:sugar phosphate isomerase/epimerase [Verrucomicrobiae bacterium]
MKISRRDFVRRTLLTSGSVLVAAQTVGCNTPGRFSAPRWQIGCYTRPWDQFDYRTALDGIAEAGFKYAGLMTAKGKSWVIITIETSSEEAAEIGGEVRQRGLQLLSLYAGDFPVAKSVPAGIEGLRKLIDNCAACGAPNLMLGGVGDEKLYDDYFTVVRECCDYAAAKGIGLSMKPHGGLNATGAQCRQAVERVGRKNFRIWYDPGNILYYSDGGLDPAEDAASVDGLVVGVSVKDYRHPKDVMVTPGTGQVNFRGVFDRLKQGGFTRGPLIVECLARGTAAQITAEARKARVFLEGLMGKLF